MDPYALPACSEPDNRHEGVILETGMRALALRCSRGRPFGYGSVREPREVARMDEWNTYTPEGRRLLVRREGEGWVAQCGDGEDARSELLDVALIEAIHRDQDVVGHAAGIDYGNWTRETADSIERAFTSSQ
jgi:hypothetical protein